MINLNKDKLIDLYVNQKLGSSTIAKIFNCSSSTILNYLKKYNIQIRDNSTASKLSANKVKETCNLRYNGIGFASIELANKSRNTNYIKNGNYFYTNRAKAKETCLNKYGVEYSGQILSSRIKTKDTLMKKYNINCSFLIPEIKIKSRSKEALMKEAQTRKNNNSFNTSKAENDFYNHLLTIFDEKDIKRQYRDERYPFNCDFYIISKDLFIEFNYHWTHGPHKFNKNSKDDLKLLENWKIKAEKSNYYKNAIYTWTDLDIRKQNIAKNNNLNYIILYKGEKL